jgi:hypothetical protein
MALRRIQNRPALKVSGRMILGAIALVVAVCFIAEQAMGTQSKGEASSAPREEANFIASDPAHRIVYNAASDPASLPVEPDYVKSGQAAPKAEPNDGSKSDPDPGPDEPESPFKPKDEPTGPNTTPTPKVEPKPTPRVDPNPVTQPEPKPTPVVVRQVQPQPTYYVWPQQYAQPTYIQQQPTYIQQPYQATMPMYAQPQYAAPTYQAQPRLFGGFRLFQGGSVCGPGGCR